TDIDVAFGSTCYGWQSNRGAGCHLPWFKRAISRNESLFDLDAKSRDTAMCFPQSPAGLYTTIDGWRDPCVINLVSLGPSCRSISLANLSVRSSAVGISTRQLLNRRSGVSGPTIEVINLAPVASGISNSQIFKSEMRGPLKLCGPGRGVRSDFNSFQ